VSRKMGCPASSSSRSNARQSSLLYASRSTPASLYPAVGWGCTLLQRMYACKRSTATASLASSTSTKGVPSVEAIRES